MNLNRRNFLKLGAAAGALAYVGGRTVSADAAAAAGQKVRKERQAIPTTCFQCPAQCGLVCFIEEGRIVKTEGNPLHPNNLGAACAKAQASASQAYDAQRIMYPMVQTKERGDRTGWKRISWDEAFNMVGKRIKGLMDANQHEKVFLFPGRDRSSGYLQRFQNAIGTPHRMSRSGTCSESNKEGFKEVWGYDGAAYDISRSKYVLNFGMGLLESASTFVPTTLRLTENLANGSVKLTTIDPRFSITASKSQRWLPVKPGTDLALALAMQYVILKENLHDKEMVKFINYDLGKYLEYLEKEGYTPEWAEKITGIDAKTIRETTREFATTKPATVYCYKGATTHINGAQTAKAILMLAALTGNLQKEGTNFYNVTASYKSVTPSPAAPTKKKHASTKSSPVSPDSSTLVFKQVTEAGVMDTMITWVHNPVYVLADSQGLIDIIKDRKKVPFFVAIDLFMSESTELADLILPDVSFLERWGVETHYPIEGVPWVSIRQPAIQSPGEGKDQCEILRGIAKAIGPDVYKFFEDTRRQYIEKQCDADILPGFKAWGGFSRLLKDGAYYQQGVKPTWFGDFKKEIKEEALKDSVFQESNGVYYQQKKDAAGKVEMKDGKPVADTTKPIGVKLSDGKVYKGWKTANLKINFFTKRWEDAFPGTGLPKWTPSIEAKEGEFLAFGFKYPTITHSRTSNCKWLSELRHDNPILMNTADAKQLGIKDGDRVLVTSAANAKQWNVKVTEGILPGTIGIGWGPGHWAYGAFATAGKDSKDANGNDIAKELAQTDKDYGRIWWKESGTNMNWLPPMKADPLGGAQEWTVAVKITKV